MTIGTTPSQFETYIVLRTELLIKITQDLKLVSENI